MTRIECSEDMAVRVGQTVQSQTAVQGIDMLVQARHGQEFYDDEGNLIGTEYTGDLLTQVEFAPDPGATETYSIWFSESSDMSNLQPLDEAVTPQTIYPVLYGSVNGLDVPDGLSVVTTLNGVALHTDTSPPYQAAGGSPTSAVPVNLSGGSNTLSMTVDGGTPITATFTAATVVPAPYNFRGDAGIGSVTLEWVMPSYSSALAALIYVDGAPGPQIDAADLEPAGTTSSYTFTGLTAGQAYDFNVVAVLGDLESESTIVKTFTPQAQPSETPVDTYIDLFLTDNILAEWESRWASPPAGYPGRTKAQILASADNLRNNPNQAVWNGPTDLDSQNRVRQVSGSSGNNPPAEPYQRMIDAAFVWQLTGTTSYRDAAKTVLLKTVRNSRLDMSRRSGGAVNYSFDIQFGGQNDSSPVHDMAHFISQHVHAYVHLGAAAFTSSERAEVNNWLYHAANFWTAVVDRKYASLYVNWGTNYALSNQGSQWASRGLLYGYIEQAGAGDYSMPIGKLQSNYSNRSSSVYRTAIEVAIKLRNENHSPTGSGQVFTVDQLYERPVRFWTDRLKYAIWPGDRVMGGDFERGTKGWKYEASNLADLHQAVLYTALRGDRRLADLATRQGTYIAGGNFDARNRLTNPGAAPQNTSGSGVASSACAGGDPDKTYLWFTKEMGEYARQYSATPFASKRQAWGGSHEVSVREGNSQWVYDACFAIGNVVWGDADVTDVYKRNLAGVPDWGDLNIQNTKHEPWGGHTQHWSSVPFQWWDLEGLVGGL